MNPLIKERDRLKQQLNDVEQKLSDELIANHYSGIAGKFVGKYFRTRNSRSADDKWWLYTYVQTIKPDDVYETAGGEVTAKFLGWRFQVTNDSYISVEAAYSGYIHLLGKEITEREFYKAHANMLLRIPGYESK